MLILTFAVLIGVVPLRGDWRGLLHFFFLFHDSFDI